MYIYRPKSLHDNVIALKIAKLVVKRLFGL